MDSQTVLDIIKQLDALAEDASKAAEEYSGDPTSIECGTLRELKAYCQGQANAFEAFSEHLQGYIEARVSAMEISNH